MTTPEGAVKYKVKQLLEKYKAYYYMPVPAGYGKPSLDFVGCYRGQFFAIETKAEGKHATARQSITAQEMISAGAAVFFIEGVNSPVFNCLERWLFIYSIHENYGFLNTSAEKNDIP
jgi:hypothetical protein